MNNDNRKMATANNSHAANRINRDYEGMAKN